ncbi:MAG: trimeric autotransporter adhesin [Verrucomicrobiota bacterium]|jgi:hypothetical protein
MLLLGYWVMAAWIFPPEVRAQTTIPLLDISTNSWRFNDSGMDLGTSWRANVYPAESGWKSGVGLFGVEPTVPYPYSPIPIRTPLVLGAGRMTYYFRTQFPLPYNPAAVIVQGTAYIDDGAVFYVNGTEIARVRMPAGPVSFTNRAQLANPEGIAFTLNVPSSSLVTGNNILAVEIHQHAPSDSDAVFGLGLQASVAEGPVIQDLAEPSDRQLRQFDSTVLTVSGTGTPTPAYRWYHDSVLVPGAQGTSLSLDNVGAADQGFYFVVLSNTIGSATSRVAHVEVLLDTNPPTALYALALPDPQEVALAFSETMEMSAAVDGFNWEVEPASGGAGLFVTFGELTDGTNVVLHTIGSRDPAVRYVVRILEGAAVGDLAGNLIPVGTRIPVASFSNAVVQLGGSQRWRYEQSGVDLGTSWRSNSFNDAGWSNGLGTFDAFRSFPGSVPVCRPSLPVIDEPVRTCLALSNANNTAQLSTAYFRTHFQFYGDAAHSLLALEALVDDGAIFYLNGSELTRLGMPFSPVFNATLANRTIGNPAFESLSLSGAGLIQGDNVLAVEVHQDGLSSPDLTFGARISVVMPDVGLGATVSGANIQLFWMPPMGTLQSADEVGGPWSNLSPSDPPNRHSEAITGLRKFYRVITP